MKTAPVPIRRTRYAKIPGRGTYHVMNNAGWRTKCGKDFEGISDVTEIKPDGARCQKCAGTVKRKRKAKVTQMTKKPPTTPKSIINPKHYALVVNGQPIQVVDVIEARFPEDAHLSQALKYLLRAGHKTDSSYTKDVGKCVWWCVRALMFNKVKHIELPPGAPV